MTWPLQNRTYKSALLLLVNFRWMFEFIHVLKQKPITTCYIIPFHWQNTKSFCFCDEKGTVYGEVNPMNWINTTGYYIFNFPFHCILDLENNIICAVTIFFQIKQFNRKNLTFQYSTFLNTKLLEAYENWIKLLQFLCWFLLKKPFMVAYCICWNFCQSYLAWKVLIRLKLRWKRE